ncbi:hypothetical protein Tco_0104262 [Tanacetum coccineum]
MFSSIDWSCGIALLYKKWISFDAAFVLVPWDWQRRFVPEFCIRNLLNLFAMYTVIVLPNLVLINLFIRVSLLVQLDCFPLDYSSILVSGVCEEVLRLLLDHLSSSEAELQIGGVIGWLSLLPLYLGLEVNVKELMVCKLRISTLYCCFTIVDNLDQFLLKLLDEMNIDLHRYNGTAREDPQLLDQMEL